MVHRQKEKASYSGLFDKGPMYNDKEVRNTAVLLTRAVVLV